MDLPLSWSRCFDDIGGSLPPPCAWEELLVRYSEPHRAYHTLQHLEECFTHFEACRSFAERPGEVAFALFYHDAVYDTHANDNELRSAELAVDVLREYVRGDADIEQVFALIMATKHDAVPDTADARLLVDIDLSILGADPSRFDEYERQVRAEYSWVAEDAFRQARRRILETFLERPAIFNLPLFRDRLEATARENLARSISALGEPT